MLFTPAMSALCAVILMTLGVEIKSQQGKVKDGNLRLLIKSMTLRYKVNQNLRWIYREYKQFYFLIVSRFNSCSIQRVRTRLNLWSSSAFVLLGWGSAAWIFGIWFCSGHSIVCCNRFLLFRVASSFLLSCSIVPEKSIQTYLNRSSLLMTKQVYKQDSNMKNIQNLGNPQECCQGVWTVTYELWHMNRDMWLMNCDLWPVTVNYALKNFCWFTVIYFGSATVQTLE